MMLCHISLDYAYKQYILNCQQPGMIGDVQPALYKLIKVYKIEREEKQSESEVPEILSVRIKSQSIHNKLAEWMKWSSIEKTDIQENFLLFPNESIYIEGVRVSYRADSQQYLLEFIKNKWEAEHSNCFCYQYEPTILYDDPIPVLKSLGYQQRKRKSKNVTIFRNMKYGLQMLLYHMSEKDENLEENKKGKLEIIETACYPFAANLMLTQIQTLLHGLIELPLQSELMHESMTLKNLLAVESFN